MGQQLSHVNEKLLSMTNNDSTQLTSDAIIADSGKDDILTLLNVRNPLESNGSNPIPVSERFHTKQIQTHLFQLTNSVEHKAINLEIYDILFENVFKNDLASHSQKTINEVEAILNQQQKLQTALMKKIQEEKNANQSIFNKDKAERQAQQLSYFAIQSLTSILLILIKSAEKHDPTIVQQILTLASQLCEQMPMKCLSFATNGTFLVKSLKPLTTYISDLSSQEDPIRNRTNDDHAKTHLHFLSWLLGRMSSLLIAGPPKDTLETKHANRLDSLLFMNGCEPTVTENSQYLMDLFKSDLAVYSHFKWNQQRQQSSSDDEFLMSVYYNQGQGAKLISKMKIHLKNKQRFLQKSIEQFVNDACAVLFAVYIKHYRRIHLAKSELFRPDHDKPHDKLLSIYEYANRVQTIFIKTKAQGGDCDNLFKQIKNNALFLLLSVKENSLIPIVNENLPPAEPNTPNLLSVEQSRMSRFKRQESRWTKAKNIIRLLRNSMHACIRLKKLMISKKQSIEQEHDPESVLNRLINGYVYEDAYGNTISIGNEDKKRESNELIQCLYRQYERAMTRLITYRFIETFIPKVFSIDDHSRALSILAIYLPHMRHIDLVEWTYAENIQASNSELKDAIANSYYSCIHMILSHLLQSTTTAESTILIPSIFRLLNLSYRSIDVCYLDRYQLIQTLCKSYMNFIEKSDPLLSLKSKLSGYTWFRLFVYKLCDNIREEQAHGMANPLLCQQRDFVFQSIIFGQLKELKRLKQTLSTAVAEPLVDSNEEKNDSLSNTTIGWFIKQVMTVNDDTSTILDIELCINQFLILLLRCVHLYEHVRSFCATVECIEELLDIYHHSQHQKNENDDSETFQDALSTPDTEDSLYVVWSDMKINRDQSIIDALSTSTLKYGGWKANASETEIEFYKQGRIGSDDISIVSIPRQVAKVQALEECGNKHRFHGRINTTSSYIQGTFPTFTFENLEFSEGKWYYCVKLPVGGLVQIGWATAGFKPEANNGRGVGDDIYSWCYDGSRSVLFHNGSYNFPSEDLQWKENDVCGCGIEIDEENTRIKYWLNGKFLGTAFSHESDPGSSRLKCNMIPHGRSTTYFPCVSLEVSYYYSHCCELIVSPEDMDDCPLPSGYKPLLTPKLIHVENSIVVYPYSAYLVGDDTQEYLHTSPEINNSMSLLRDFVNEDHLETTFTLDDQWLIVPENSGGLSFPLNTLELSLTISFDLKIASTTSDEDSTNNKQNILLLKLDHIEMLSISIPSDENDDDEKEEVIHIAIVFYLKEKQTKVYVNDRCRTFLVGLDPKTMMKSKLFLLPNGGAQIRNLGLWKYALSEEHIRRLFTYGLFYVAVDYHERKEYRKQANTFLFSKTQPNFPNELLLPFNEPFEESQWLNKKKQKQEIKIYQNAMLVIDVNVNYERIRSTVNHIYLFRELDLTKNTISENTLRIQCKSITFQNQPITAADINEYMQSPNCSLETWIAPSLPMITSSLVAIGYKESWIKSMMEQYNTRNLQLLDTLIREHKEELLKKDHENQRTHTLDILSKLGPSIHREKLENLIMFAKLDTDEDFAAIGELMLSCWEDLQKSTSTSDIIETENDNKERMAWFYQTVRRLGIKGSMNVWMQDKSKTHDDSDSIYQLLDLTKPKQDQSIGTQRKLTKKSLQYSHQGLTQKQYLDLRIACEHGLITIYARETILNMLEVWLNDQSSLFPWKKFGDYTFILRLIRLLDYHSSYSSTRADQRSDRMSPIIKSILKLEIDQLSKQTNMNNHLEKHAPLLYHLQKDLVVQSIRFLEKPSLLMKNPANEPTMTNEQMLFKEPNLDFLLKIVSLFSEIVTDQWNMNQNEIDTIIPILFPELLITLLFDLFLLVPTHQAKICILHLFAG
ncbi:unnamed protein product [Rotaria sordida]|uniref:B30.2/SPRY domain-containing protein n=1 Tax=Rotaria sordida TaxID=392033 RepID=A0A819EJV2_9BILA|nr:unnamed protein product [Rotaria sordida]